MIAAVSASRGHRLRRLPIRDGAPEIERQSLPAWVNASYATMAGTDRGAVGGVRDQARQRLTDKTLKPDDRALIRIVLSAAHGRLAELGEDRISNGMTAFSEIEQAVKESPSYEDAVTSYGRTILAFTKRSWAERTGITLGLGISISSEASRAAKLLGQFPSDAFSQQLRLDLASWAGDKHQVKEAQNALAKLDPKSVEWAKGTIGGDQKRSEQQKR
jgi:hypothetical protein